MGSFESDSTLPRKEDATALRPSSGHGSNKEMVQQLMSEGNWRRALRSVSPEGNVGN
jgi:hypothetical protein